MLYAADARWWRHYWREVDATTSERWTMSEALIGEPGWQWIRGVDEPGISRTHDRIHTGGNSGFQAVGLAVLFGAARVLLLGFDMQPTGNVRHFHADHAATLGNPIDFAVWRERFQIAARDLRDLGVEVINCSRETALATFERRPLPVALGLKRAAVVIEGMHGLGDNLHQRALVRQLLFDHDVWLETPWPQVYHDLVGAELHLTTRGSGLRTQAKNAKRSRALYVPGDPPPKWARQLRIHYPPAAVRQCGSVLRAMARTAGLEPGDFRLPIPGAWAKRADELLAVLRKAGPYGKRPKPNAKPLMIYRPLIERKEWDGCSARNPDHGAYGAIFRSLRERFFVISVADLVPDVEWTVGPDVDVDSKLHAGELDFETMAALFARAALVMSSPGFAVVLAQAVGVPVVAVFGGYENSSSFREGAKWSPYLGIDPIKPCNDFAHGQHHDKRIDVDAAIERVRVFVDGALPAERVNRRPIEWGEMPTTFCNPGEMEAIVELARSVKARAALEIGCNDGRTSRLLLDNVSGLRRVVGVDVPRDYAINSAQRGEVPRNPGRLAAGDSRFELVLRDQGSFDLTVADFGAERFDLIFIDGDHSRDAVEHDTALARALVSKGGVIVWHDYHWQGNVDVREVLDEQRLAGAPIVRIADTWLAIERH